MAPRSQFVNMYDEVGFEYPTWKLQPLDADAEVLAWQVMSVIKLTRSLETTTIGPLQYRLDISDELFSQIGIKPLKQIVQLKILIALAIRRLIAGDIYYDDEKYELFELARCSIDPDKIEPNLIITLHYPDFDDFYSKLAARYGTAQHDTRDYALSKCFLRLHDVELRLKVGENRELPIARLHEDSEPYKLFVKLFNAPAGTRFNSAEIFPLRPHRNLKQLLAKGGYGYLEPFFEALPVSQIAIKPEVILTKSEITSILTSINEKYRKVAKLTLVGD